MTTIAYKDGVLAADTRATGACGIKSRFTKIYRLTSKVDPVRGPVLLGLTGDIYMAMRFKDWMEAGGVPTLHDWIDGDQTECDALIVHKSGLYSGSQLCRIVPNDEPYWAEGSGAHYAMAAMYCGKSAIEAVRVAAHFDSYTGGRIVSEVLDPPKPTSKVRRSAS